MPTILIVEGYRVIIYPRDHLPPHVHVKKGGDEAIIELQPISVRDSYGFSSRELRKAVRVVEEHQEILLDAWDEFHKE